MKTVSNVFLTNMKILPTMNYLGTRIRHPRKDIGGHWYARKGSCAYYRGNCECL